MSPSQPMPRRVPTPDSSAIDTSTAAAKEPASRWRRSRWRPSRRTRAALALVLVLAAALRWGFSTSEPNASGFFFDERISFENIEPILETGSLRPRSYWYQSLSYLPQTALLATSEALWRTTGWQTFQVRDERGFRPIAYRLCRGTTILFGVLSIWLLFRLGRRLFSERVGWLAALLLAFLPWHIFTSARFKPDSLLLLLTLVTLGWIFDVADQDSADQPSLARYVRAGVGIGLTVATKLNGFVIAVPLGVLVLLRMRPGRDTSVSLRRAARNGLLGLVSAAGVAVAVYLVLNPWVPQTLETLDQNREYYSLAAEREGSGHADVLLRSLASLVEPQFHGGLIGLAVVVGVLLALATALGRGTTVARPATARAPMQALLLLSFPVAQILINAAATERFKENHLVQIAPFTCLLAAHALVELLRLPSRLSPRRRGLEVLVSLLVAGVVGSAGVRAVDAVHSALVPTTFEAAIRTLSQRDSAPGGSNPGPRWICTEVAPSRPDLQLARNLGFMVTALGDWEESTRLEVCDVLLFDARRLADAEGPYSRRLAETPEALRLRVDRAWLERRGDDLVVLSADWRPLGDRFSLATTPAATHGDRVVVELPGCVAPEQARSLELRVPIADLRQAWPKVNGALADELQWHHAGKRRPGHLFRSTRIPCHADPTRFEITIGGTPPPGTEIGVWVRRWRRGQEN